MRRIFVIFLLAFLVSSAHAAAVSTVQNTLSGVLQSKMAARGFAANDPRFVSTLTAAGSSIVGAVGAAALVTAAGVSAPAWVTVAATAGLGSLLTTGVSLGVDALVKWYANSDGTVKVDGAQVPIDSALGTNQCYSTYPGTACAGSKQAVCDTLGVPAGTKSVASGNTCYMVGAANSSCPNVGDCPQATIYIKSGTPASQTGTITFTDSSSAASAIPSSEASQAVNPALLAAIANQAWMNAAASSGYSGLPYDASNPITTSDVQAWQSQNPAYYPTVQDLISPQPAPVGGTATTPFTLPTSSTPQTSADPTATPSTVTNPAASNPLENLGGDPNIGMPTLENIPTVAQILDPVFSLFPSLRQYAMPQHTATCPTATLNLFNHTQAFDAHCNLLEQVRSIVAAVMAAVWVFVSLRVVLSA
jgi:hypothetical protein